MFPDSRNPKRKTVVDMGNYRYIEGITPTKDKNDLIVSMESQSKLDILLRRKS